MEPDETSPKAIGRRLKALRLGYGLTQQAMGVLLGYKSPRGQAWQHFEIGDKKLTIDGFDRLQRRFSVPYRWVYYGEIGDCPPLLLERICEGTRMLFKNPQGRVRSTNPCTFQNLERFSICQYCFKIIDVSKMEISPR